MKCPLTGKPCVKIKYISVVDKKVEHLVCEECIHQTQSSEKIQIPKDDDVCADCGLSLSEMIKTSRFGCSRCYDNFHDTIVYIIASLQNATREVTHRGCVPKQFLMEVSRKTTKEEFVRELNEKIEKACSEDDYERASAIRSEIRKVEEGESSPEEFALLVFHYRLRELEGLK